MALQVAEHDTSGWLVFDMAAEDGTLHIVPNFGPKHVCTSACWCHPDCTDTDVLIIHNVAQ